MQCNIDAHGRKVRMILGSITCVIAIVLAILGYLEFGTTFWTLVIPLSLLTIGLFQIFEGIKGWCVMRAMGIKTRV